jgi:photosystem II stability/assembly factor-like uncharacterized protein
MDEHDRRRRWGAAAAAVVADERVLIAGEDGIFAARALGFRVFDQTRVVTAVSELARNVVRYAAGGRFTRMGRLPDLDGAVALAASLAL